MIRTLLMAGSLLSISSIASAEYTFSILPDNDIAENGYSVDGISSNGLITGTAFSFEGTNFGIIHDTVTNTFSPTRINDPNSPISSTFVQGINNRGQVVGGYFVSNNSTSVIINGFIFDGNNYVDLIEPNVVTTGILRQTLATGINDNGVVVGQFTGNANSFIYDNGVYTEFFDDDPTILQTSAEAINNDGVIVGSLFVNNALNPEQGIGPTQEGFIYNNGTFTIINDPNAAVNSEGTIGSFGTVATGINNLGDIVGYYYDVTGITHGFFYRDGNFTTIDYPGLASGEGTFLNGISDSGQIVGLVTNSTGGISFLASPAAVPVPAAVWLFTSALAGFGFVGRRKTV